MDDESDERDEQPAEPAAADFSADLDQLAVVEAELAAAEAELDALDEPSGDQDPAAAS